MPVLVDGNNLMHALASAGADYAQTAVCRMLSRLVERGERVCVVFDGPAPPPPLDERLAEFPVESLHAGRRPADYVILDRIASDTAPRRLTVVSTDHEIRAAARKRRCTVLTSEQFVPVLLRAAAEPTKGPAEPPEKQEGLSPDQTRKWLREFGYDE